MAWVVFANAAAFNTYHQAVCIAQAIPHPGYRQSDTALEIMNQWTTSWVQPFYAGPNVLSPIVAEVPDTDVVIYGLTLTSAPGIGATVTQYPSTAIAKPPTWTDPNTGFVYNTTTGQRIA